LTKLVERLDLVALRGISWSFAFNDEFANVELTAFGILTAEDYCPINEGAPPSQQLTTNSYIIGGVVGGVLLVAVIVVIVVVTGKKRPQQFVRHQDDDVFTGVSLRTVSRRQPGTEEV
jgi:hypothetical protein